MELNITRAWKDANYRENLTSEEHALLPENPIGTLELADEALATINGALSPQSSPALNFYNGDNCNYDGGWYGSRRSGGCYGGRRSGGWYGGTWYGGRRSGGWYGGGYSSCGY